VEKQNGPKRSGKGKRKGRRKKKGGVGKSSTTGITSSVRVHKGIMCIMDLSVGTLRLSNHDEVIGISITARSTSMDGGTGCLVLNSFESIVGKVKDTSGLTPEVKQDLGHCDRIVESKDGVEGTVVMLGPSPKTVQFPRHLVTPAVRLEGERTLICSIGRGVLGGKTADITLSVTVTYRSTDRSVIQL
jgi:hypothetical protein